MKTTVILLNIILLGMFFYLLIEEGMPTNEDFFLALFFGLTPACTLCFLYNEKWFSNRKRGLLSLLWEKWTLEQEEKIRQLRGSIKKDELK